MSREKNKKDKKRDKWKGRDKNRHTRWLTGKTNGPANTHKVTHCKPIQSDTYCKPTEVSRQEELKELVDEETHQQKDRKTTAKTNIKEKKAKY